MKSPAALLLAAALTCPTAMLTACSTGEQTQSPAAEIALVQPAECGSVNKLSSVGNLYLAGQPSAEDFALFKERGVKTVLNIRHESETPSLDEQAVVEKLGMTYVNVPWGGPDELTDEKFAAMREVLREAERPILFHCGTSNRVGAGWMAYRVLDEGVPLEQAKAEAKSVGLRTPAYETKAVDYIQRQQPGGAR